MLTFAAAVFFLIVTPGPGVLSTAGVGSAFGARAGTRYVMGLFIGTNLVALAVITGLAALILAYPLLRSILFILSTGYLLYLAFRIATAGSKLAFVETAHEPGIWDGIALQAVNPKAYVVNTTLFSGFAFLASAPLAEAAIKLVIVNAIWLPIHFAWLWAGITLRRLNLGAHVQRVLNLGMAGAMLLVVGLAVWSVW